MPKTIRSLQALFLVCLAPALTGCLHPMTPVSAGTNHPLSDARSAAHFQNAMQTSAPTVKPVPAVDFVADGGAPESSKPGAKPDATAPKEPASLTGQLADSLLTVFKTFTGR